MFKKKIFLGGTCGETDWRTEFIKRLDGKYNYFNPIVDVWDEKARKKEEDEKVVCDFHLFYISPEMRGFYSFIEAIDSLHLVYRPTLLFVHQYDSFGDNWGSIKATCELFNTRSKSEYISEDLMRHKKLELCKLPHPEAYDLMFQHVDHLMQAYLHIYKG